MERNTEANYGNNHLLKKFVVILLIAFTAFSSATAQNLLEGQKRWSSNKRLTVDDFQIKMSDENNYPVYSQFVISHAINGFDFFKKNLNQKIDNVFYGNASWVDTTRVDDVEKQIDFQQLQFDLAEVHTRRFRKRVFENKGQIAKGFDIINQISNEIMSELSVSRLQLVKETQSGVNEERLAEWKEKIAHDLKELEDFSYENKKIIK